MFIVILTVIALADYVITFCCILEMVAKPADKTAITPKDIYEEDKTMNSVDMGFVCDDKEFDGYEKNFNSYDKDFNSYIEEQNSRIALLSFNVNEILSNIDSIIERDKINQEALSA
jgi:hypothetical protein